VTETTALGAAFLAGLAAGVWTDLDQIAAAWRMERRFEPSRSADWRQSMLHQWRRAVERTLNWADAG
jgi:glycerol kinase